MQSESLAKAYVLTHGVRFTAEALVHAARVNAKRQNMVYNLPRADAAGDRPAAATASRSLLLAADPGARPQELFLGAADGYKVCVSAVAPVAGREPAIVACRAGRLALATPARPVIGEALASVAFVPQPAYYQRQTRSGRDVTRWVSACGYDEMNIWPWHDCAISRPCTFCGINTVQKKAGRDLDLFHALDFRREPSAARAWQAAREPVLAEIVEAVDLAIDDACYRDEIHLILISGNFADHQLDDQARVYADIAAAITRRHPGRFAEGAVAVTAPPGDPDLLEVMRDGGIAVGVFNLEAYGTAAFARHCPGKHRIGREHYLATLMRGVEVFGHGRAWCNFVLGLEPVEELLAGCDALASWGVTPGANVLHRDQGARVHHDPPEMETVIAFYRKLAAIYRQHGHRPYYCQLALRTSLANEAFAGRLD